MPGDDDGLTPDAAPSGGEADKPKAEGVPDEENVDEADFDEQLDSDPEDVSLNRRDVPDTPANSIEARTEGS